ncbi:FmdB family zinc ribbon protein [Poriferisphaera sp. WC338]|uniref:FmdB family zinc ribbon protein n=1 Tax=Poriferisphaera sp. WC338 TaxID=3425129 RepID=UPI003D81B05F
MPVYEYECAKCEEVTEVIRRMADADEPIACEHCDSKKTSRKHSVFSACDSTSTSSSSASMPGGSCGSGCCCHPH